MRRLSLVAALAATLLVAMVVPAGGASAKTLPFQGNCEDGYGQVLFDIIAAEGSIVGFFEGKPVVFHGVQGAFIVTVTIDGDDFDEVAFEEDFLKGKGKGLKLTDCEADADFEIENFSFTIGEDATEEDILAFFDELGINPYDFEGEEEVTFISTFEGDVQVQFPGR